MSEPVTEAPRDDQTRDEPGSETVPNPDTGAGIGADQEPSTFEPEEDPETVDAGPGPARSGAIASRAHTRQA